MTKELTSSIPTQKTRFWRGSHKRVEQLWHQEHKPTAKTKTKAKKPPTGQIDGSTAKRRARDSNPQPVTRHHISSVAASQFAYPPGILRGPGDPAGSGDLRTTSLHGLNAVWLAGTGWYRIDARGNRAGIDAQFSPPVERLAFSIGREGEVDFPEVWAEPLSVVVEALRSHESAQDMALPDVEVWGRVQGSG